MKKYFSVWWIITILVSCSTIPPPRVENGTYINPEFGFSLKIPSGWVNSKPIPPWVLDQIPPTEKMYLKFMFTNTQPQLGIMSKGRILASCSKLEIPWEKLILSWDKVTALLTKRLGNKKISTDRKSHIKKYSYRTYNLSTAVCLIPAYDEEIDEYHLKLLTNCFYYKCNDLMACKIVFYAISTPEMFKTNSPAYKKMIQTFTIIDEKY